jgi:hypothetical protein
MCIFSARQRAHALEKVSATNIFARCADDGRGQILVYSMNLQTRADLAMILPLPVPAGTPEQGVRFISLEKYPQFFQDMRAGFPEYLPRSRGAILSVDAVAARKPLPVHDVGDFEASYVPTMNDWDRLDERFRAPPGLFDAVPAYHHHGFAVFKLKATRSSSSIKQLIGLKAKTRTIHPMAFEFPRADPDRLFFPTVHVHDGEFHASAEFDHALYFQLLKPRAVRGWRTSDRPAGDFMKADRAAGTIVPELFCHRREIRGKHANEDIFV